MPAACSRSPFASVAWVKHLVLRVRDRVPGNAVAVESGLRNRSFVGWGIRRFASHAKNRGRHTDHFGAEPVGEIPLRGLFHRYVTWEVWRRCLPISGGRGRGGWRGFGDHFRR